MTFWDCFITLCNNANVAPNGVAKELGIGSATVTGWKKGAKPSDRYCKKIADRFGVTNWEALKDGSLFGEDTKKDPAPDGAESELDIEFASLVADLTEDERCDVMEYIRFKKSQRGK